MSKLSRNYFYLHVGWTTLFLTQCTVPSTIVYLQTNEGFSLEDIGNILSCFGLAYSLTKLASGFLYDNLHLNPKYLLCLGLSSSGLLCLLFPLAVGSSVSLASIVWLAVGSFQGLGWPACARMIKQWYGPTEVGRKYLLLSAASNIASTVAPILSVGIATTMYWWYIYYLLGFGCLIVSGILLAGIKYSPPENSLSENGTDSREQAKSKMYHWYDVFIFKEFWLVTLLSVNVFTVKASILSWLPLYLTQQLNHSDATAAQCSSMGELGSVVAKLFFAVISDFLIKKRMLIRQGLCPRAPLLLILATLVALSTYLYTYHVTSESSHLWLTMVCFSVGFSIGGMLGTSSLSLMESVPTTLSATALAIGDSTTHLVGRSLLGYTVFSYMANNPLWGWSASYMVISTVGFIIVGIALLLVTSHPSPHEDSGKDKHD